MLDGEAHSSSSKQWLTEDAYKCMGLSYASAGGRLASPGLRLGDQALSVEDQDPDDYFNMATMIRGSTILSILLFGACLLASIHSFTRGITRDPVRATMRRKYAYFRSTLGDFRPPLVNDHSFVLDVF